jgi:hypothetical protein
MSTGNAIQFQKTSDRFPTYFHRCGGLTLLQGQSVSCLIVGDVVLPEAEEDA